MDRTGKLDPYKRAYEYLYDSIDELLEIDEVELDADTILQHLCEVLDISATVLSAQMSFSLKAESLKGDLEDEEDDED